MDKKHLDMLFLEFMAGDNSVFEEIYNYSYQDVFGFLLSLTKNYTLAQDLTQNTYIELNNSLKRYVSKDASITYLFLIAKRQYYSYLKKNKNLDYYDNVDILSPTTDDYLEDEFFLKKTLEILSVEERSVVFLYIVKELKHKDIAKILDIPLGTVLWRYNKAVKKLKKEFGENYE